MFGIVKPCRHTLSPELREQWRAHLCGLCLSLRDQHGQLARCTTNVDAIALSVLAEAQQERAGERVHAGHCPLRGMRTASVLGANDPGIVHATAVSLTMASSKVRDHALDGDGFAGRVPRLSTGLARRWRHEGDTSGRRVAFDTAVLHAAVVDSDQRERDPGRGFDHHVGPTEEAAAAACAHTAVLAGRPGNVDALRSVGRAFGRITYLLDAVDDEQEDLDHGAFNALVAAFPDPDERRPEARRLFDAAHAELRAAFDRLDLVRPDLARALFVDQLRRAGQARFGTTGTPRVCAVHQPAADVPRTGILRPLAKLTLALGLQLPSMHAAFGRTGQAAGIGPGIDPMVAQQEPGKRHWWDNCDCGCDDDCCCCCEGACCCSSCDCCDCGCDC